MARPIHIFFSYAHNDEPLVDEVRRQLIGYDRRNIIRKWHDRLISPGAEWRGQIDARLRHCDIILLFISPHFIESEYCYDVEMTEAMRRHHVGEARVIPVILRPCLWHDEPFGRLQSLPTRGRALVLWENRDEGALDVAKGVMEVVRQINSELVEPSARMTSVPNSPTTELTNQPPAVAPLPPQPASLARDALDALWRQGEKWLETFDEDIPSESETDEWWSRCVAVVKSTSLASYIALPDIRQFQDSTPDEWGMLRRLAESADRSESWTDDDNRIKVFSEIYAGVKKLHRVLLKLDGDTSSDK
jgi:hypothetical protein